MMNNIIRFILILLMVFTSITAYASYESNFEGLVIGILFLFVALPCLVIFLGFIITSTVFLIQCRETSARRIYGKVAQVLSILLILPYPILIRGDLMFDSIFSHMTLYMGACALMAIPGTLSAFFAHKVKNLPLENSEG